MKKGIEKKLNHYVPRTLLRGWETRQEGYNNFNIFDVEDQKILRPTKKRCFAAEDDLYVVEENGQRDLSVENFFGVNENILGDFLAKLKNEKSLDKYSMEKWGLVIESLVCLPSRNPKLINTLTQAYRIADPKRELFKTDVDLKKHVLNILLEQIDNVTERFLQNPPLIIRLGVDDLILSESPFWDVLSSKFKKNVGIVPIRSNMLFMAGDYSSMLEDYQLPNGILFLDLKQNVENSIKLARMINDFTIERCRQWVVFSHSARKEVLEIIKSRLTKEEVLKRAEQDTFKIQIGDRLTSVKIKDIV